jgi:hypothetical protein
MASHLQSNNSRWVWSIPISSFPHNRRLPLIKAELYRPIATKLTMLCVHELKSACRCRQRTVRTIQECSCLFLTLSNKVLPAVFNGPNQPIFAIIICGRRRDPLVCRTPMPQAVDPPSSFGEPGDRTSCSSIISRRIPLAMLAFVPCLGVPL